MPRHENEIFGLRKEDVDLASAPRTCAIVPWNGGTPVEIQIHFRRNARPFTPARPIAFAGRYIRQASSLDAYGHVEMILEPIPEFTVKPSWGAPSRYSWEVRDDVVPSIYFDAVLDGIKLALEEDDAPFDCLEATRVRVVGGSFNETDSRPQDYVIASRQAMKDTLRKVLETSG